MRTAKFRTVLSSVRGQKYGKLTLFFPLFPVRCPSKRIDNFLYAFYPARFFSLAVYFPAVDPTPEKRRNKTEVRRTRRFISHENVFFCQTAVYFDGTQRTLQPNQVWDGHASGVGRATLECIPKLLGCGNVATSLVFEDDESGSVAAHLTRSRVEGGG